MHPLIYGGGSSEILRLSALALVLRMDRESERDPRERVCGQTNPIDVHIAALQPLTLRRTYTEKRCRLDSEAILTNYIRQFSVQLYSTNNSNTN